MSSARVTAVILNTNRREDTLACLASLAASTYPALDVIVLDNASTDGSVDAIGAAFPQVRVIGLTENLGYAGNNNVGIQAALDGGADWVFVLNEDTVMAPDCIEALVAAGQQSPRIGMAGPRIYHYEPPTMIQSAGGYLTGAWKSGHLRANEYEDEAAVGAGVQAAGASQAPYLVEWITGCAMLVRRSAIEQVGMIDARFFYYWEETDWCRRVGQAGWQIVHVPAAKLWHKGVQPNYQPSPSVTYYNTRNRFLFMSKGAAPLLAWCAVWAEVIRTGLSWSLLPKWRHMQQHRDALVQGAVDFLRQRWGMRQVEELRKSSQR
jgi:GT2 family glycosyltransferase